MLKFKYAATTEGDFYSKAQEISKPANLNVKRHSGYAGKPFRPFKQCKNCFIIPTLGKSPEEIFKKDFLVGGFEQWVSTPFNFDGQECIAFIYD